MSILVWDEVGSREYETGIDRGVLYPPTGPGIPWNGLISVTESSSKEVAPVFYEGMKISHISIPGDFSGSLKAITYPDEFLELEGFSSIREGVFLGEQKPKPFGLSYRTKIGNDVTEDLGYKIHILYNVTAIPSSNDYSTVSDTLNLTEFEWNITTVPEEIPGLKPTAHFIIDSTELNPGILDDIEAILYGSESSYATLLPFYDLVSFFRNLYRIRITNNFDGTWTADTELDNVIVLDGDGNFEITSPDAEYIDSDSYTISDTL